MQILTQQRPGETPLLFDGGGGGLNSVAKLMMCAKNWIQMMMSERTSGRAMPIHAWLAEKQMTEERDSISKGLVQFQK